MTFIRNTMYLKSLILHVTQIGVIGSILNEHQFESTVCASEELRASCQNDQRMIIDTYKAGVKDNTECQQNNQRNKANCCSRNDTIDCLSTIEDIEAYSLCTGKSSCLLPPKNSNVSCGNNSYEMNYHSLQYNCIEEHQFESTVCASEELRASCQNDQRMIIDTYKAGVKDNAECQQNNQRNKANCCSRNDTIDCLSTIEDIEAYSLCTGKSSCLLPPKNSNVSCGNNSYEMNYHSLQYNCIEEYRLGECHSSVQRSCKGGQSLYLSSPGYPSNVTGSVSCVCVISSDLYEKINIYMVDIQISWEEVIMMTDSAGPFRVRNEDTQPFTSFIGSSIKFNSTLLKGRFLIAISPLDGGILTIKCPMDTQINASNCDESVTTQVTKTNTHTTEISHIFSSVSSVNTESTYDYTSPSENTQSIEEASTKTANATKYINTTSEAYTQSNTEPSIPTSSSMANTTTKTTTKTANATKYINTTSEAYTQSNTEPSIPTFSSMANTATKTKISWYIIAVPLLVLVILCPSIIIIYRFFKKRFVWNAQVAQKPNSLTNTASESPYSKSAEIQRDEEKKKVVDNNVRNGDVSSFLVNANEKDNISPSKTISQNTNVTSLPPLDSSYPLSNFTSQREERISEKRKKKKKKKRKHKENEHQQISGNDILQVDEQHFENGTDQTKKKRKKRKHKRDEKDNDVSNETKEEFSTQSYFPRIENGISTDNAITSVECN